MKLKKEEIKEEVKEEKKEIKKVDVPDFYMLSVGETISDVSEKFGIAENEIIKLNGNTVIGGNQIKLK